MEFNFLFYLCFNLQLFEDSLNIAPACLYVFDYIQGIHSLLSYARVLLVSLLFYCDVYFSCMNCCCKAKEFKARSVPLGLERVSDEKYPRNVVRNQKYSVISFIPKVCNILLLLVFNSDIKVVS